VVSKHTSYRRDICSIFITTNQRYRLTEFLQSTHCTLQDESYMCRSRSAIPSASPTTVRVPGRSPSASIYLFQVSSTDDGFEDQGILLGIVSYIPLSQTCRFEVRVYGILIVQNFWKPRTIYFHFNNTFTERGNSDMNEEIWYSAIKEFYI
jgi:hypothetical protein